MLDYKDIKVEIYQNVAFTIPGDKRHVNAQQINKLFEFELGDVFKLEKENPKEIDQ